MHSLSFICLVGCLLKAAFAATSNDRFDEHLTLRPLADGRLHTFFTFTLQPKETQSGPTSTPIYSIVPRSLVHLARSSEAEEIHMAINAGRWDYQRWGDPGQEQMVGTGAYVKAKLRHKGTQHDRSSAK